MTCSQFVARFSDYHDGTGPVEFAREADRHLAECPACQRYRHVVERGAVLLRSIPGPQLREDFGARLRHRLYHVDQEDLLARHTASGTTAVAVAGLSVVLAAVAWSPTLRPSAPVVELAPIVVSHPPAVRARSGSLRPFGAFPAASAVHGAGLWDDANVLLFEYSPLSQRYGQREPLRRAGLEEDR